MNTEINSLRSTGNPASSLNPGKILVFASLAILAADFIYKTLYGITPATKDRCLLFIHVPRWAFWFYEYFIELSLIMIAGIFLAGLAEKHISRVIRFFPTNPLTAFVAASIIPVCSCGVVPFISAFRNRTSVWTMVTFMVAAPLLNPYIILISFSVLGPVYGFLRIAASFVLSVSVGLIMQIIGKNTRVMSLLKAGGCIGKHGCTRENPDFYARTWEIFRKLIPFILLAGCISVSLEVAGPVKYFKANAQGGEIIGILLALLIGIPLYLCNGADVLIIKPLLEMHSISMATAMTFSLASTSVCVTSLMMLWKFMGRNWTLIFLGLVTLMILLIALILLYLPI